MLKHLRFDIFELRETKLPVRLINTTNERRLAQGHETLQRVKGDIKDVTVNWTMGDLKFDKHTSFIEWRSAKNGFCGNSPPSRDVLRFLEALGPYTNLLFPVPERDNTTPQPFPLKHHIQHTKKLRPVTQHKERQVFVPSSLADSLRDQHSNSDKEAEEHRRDSIPSNDPTRH
ncbi:hypothetical protein TNCV_3332451 [Trichonephila clavipes]|nr:hypothetical protein TNCV_3332451 [Trichonephila clavipes]